MYQRYRYRVVLWLLLVMGFSYSCKQKSKVPAENALEILIDGSSSVYPITAAIADLYKTKYNDCNISIAVSGTGGGFEKFTQKETHINNASRKIKPKEIQSCQENKVGFMEIEVAYDGIAVVVNRDNDWIDYLTKNELKEIWSHEGAIYWSDIRAEWPKKAIEKYGPGEASGTYDYFKKVIIEDSEMTDNYTKSENDNLLVRGIMNKVPSIGFFGLAYFKEYKNDLKLVAIENGKGPVLPNKATITNGLYTPLSRSMYLYVSESIFDHETSRKFVTFYLDNVASLAEKVGYVSLPETKYTEAKERLALTK